MGMMLHFSTSGRHTILRLTHLYQHATIGQYLAAMSWLTCHQRCKLHQKCGLPIARHYTPCPTHCEASDADACHCRAWVSLGPLAITGAVTAVCLGVTTTL